MATNKDLQNLRQDLKDELSAINNYQEHIDSTKDKKIKEILSHIRDDEKEHFAELVKLVRNFDKTEDKKFKKEGL